MAQLPVSRQRWTPPAARLEGDRLLKARAAQQRVRDAAVQAEAEAKVALAQEEKVLGEKVDDLEKAVETLIGNIPKMLPASGGGRRTIEKVLRRIYDLPNGLGSAAGNDTEDFATAEQGGKADSAMQPAVYDPTGVGADAFSQDSMVDGTTNKNYTATDKAKVDHLTVTGDIDLDDALLGANDPDATTDFVIGLLRLGGREFIPEAHGAPDTWVAGVGDDTYLQTAIDNAYSRYVLTGRVQAIRLIRRYELANPRSVGVADFASTLSRNVFIELFPGVDLICDPGAGVRIADGMDLTYDHVILYQEDADHPSLGWRKFRTANFDLDYNPDNNARDHYASGPYQGTGWWFPAVTPVSVEFANYHSYGCQLVADISATQIPSASKKLWVSNITDFKISGFIEEFGRNTGPVSIDTSALFIHCDPAGEIYLHDFDIEGAIGTNGGKRLNTGMELHGNVVFGDNVNARYFYAGTLWMSTYGGNNRIDARKLNVEECATGISLWPLKDPNAIATPSISYRSIKCGARVRLRPHQWVQTHPWLTASGTVNQAGGAVTSITVSTAGNCYDPNNPPVFTVSGTGGGTVVLGTPTFTSGKTIGAFVKECGEGYTSEPTVTPSAGDSVWQALVDGRGRVYAVNLVSGGASDTAPPTLTISGGGGSGATARAFGSWGIASIPVTNGGSGVSGTLTLVQDDSANGILRNGTSMVNCGLYLNPPGSLTPLPIGTLDLTGFDVKVLDDVSNINFGSAHASVYLLQNTGTTAYNIDELILGGVHADFANSGILISNTKGQPYNKLINNGTIIENCCRSAVVSLSSQGHLHIVATAGTVTGQITDLSGPLHIIDNADVAAGLIRLVNTNSDTASAITIDDPTFRFKDGGSTTKPFSFSITNASTILSLKAKMDEGHYGSGNYVDCKTGSRVDFTDSAKYVVKTASGSSNWKAKDLNPAITVAQPTITSGTAVQNTSDRYMHIAGVIAFSTGGTCQLAIGSTSAASTGIGEASSPDAARVTPFSLVVPPGYWYKITLASATVAVTTVLLGPA